MLSSGVVRQVSRTGKKAVAAIGEVRQQEERVDGSHVRANDLLQHRAAAKNREQQAPKAGPSLGRG